jgi:hypothetical protein
MSCRFLGWIVTVSMLLIVTVSMLLAITHTGLHQSTQNRQLALASLVCKCACAPYMAGLE